jgi:putative endonuclease
MASTARASLGRAGEQAALDAYLARGFSLVARNWRCPLGELDLVVRRGSLIALVEVKTRAGSAFGGPFDAVGWRKQHKLRQLGEAFIAANRGAGEGVRYRFDVASVMPGRGGRPQVELFEDAF